MWLLIEQVDLEGQCNMHFCLLLHTVHGLCRHDACSDELLVGSNSTAAISLTLGSRT